MKTRILLIGLCVLSWAVCAQATVLTYDAAADFSAVSNPNGAWTYGRDLTAFVLNTVPQPRPIIGGSIDNWLSGASIWDPAVQHNGTGITLTTAWNVTYTPGALALAPHSGYAGVRWTAPQAGTVDIGAVFTYIQPDQGVRPNLYVYKNMTELFSQLGYQWLDPTALYTGAAIPVAVGDTITFVAGTGGPAGVTQLDAIIGLTPIPEPSSLLLLGTGLLGLLAYAWRKRK